MAYVYRRDLPEDATESIITFTADDTKASVSVPKNDGNLMKGTFQSIAAPVGSYVLLTDGDFHPVAAGTTVKVGAYRAYLDLSLLASEGEEVNAKAYSMVFEDKNVTGVNAINADNGIYDNTGQQPKAYFDMLGHRVNTPLNGNVYIVNGKKVLYNE